MLKHGSPPYIGMGFVHVRLRVFIPPPHVTEQDDQLDQSDRAPCTKQTCLYLNPRTLEGTDLSSIV